MATIPYTATATVTVPPSLAIVAGTTVQASITIAGTPTAVVWAPLSPYAATNVQGNATLTATFSVPLSVEKGPFSADATFTVYDTAGAQIPITATITANPAAAPAEATSSASSPSPTSFVSQTTTTLYSITSSSPSSSNSTASFATAPSSPLSVPAGQPTQTELPTISKGYSTADLAGAAVGCGIGGAVLVGLAAFLFYRRRKRKASGILPGAGSAARSGKRHPDPSPSNEDVVVVETRAWEKHLPQSESDQAVRNMASRTLDQIEMHVENFYRDATNVSISHTAASEMRDLDCSHLPDSASNLIRTSRRPTSLIKHCIANLILSRIDFTKNSNDSFLPRDMMMLQSSLKTAPENPGFAQALAHWRVLSAYLRQEPQHDEEYLTERDQRINAAAEKLCVAFEPWARSADNTRFRSMVGIMQRASDLGVMLFSQPASFRWQWEASNRGGVPQNGPGKVAVLPGLYKVTDEEARSLASPLHLIEPRLSREGWF
ncbi:hypothetical protein CLAIMM_05891 [Cladophialophora immunda]|nr:hypothetical protein CLAIMM_05891 [Cladophialophora immunda]